jgi:hypothetical protein
MFVEYPHNVSPCGVPIPEGNHAYLECNMSPVTGEEADLGTFTRNNPD